VTQKGTKPFSDVKEIAFFSAVPKVKVTRPVFILEAEPKLTHALKGWGIAASEVHSISDVRGQGAIVIVGPGYLQPGKSASDLIAYAKSGGRVICLEQENPLQGGDLPTALAVGKYTDNGAEKTYTANFTFAQGLGSSMLAGLGENDFSNWAGGAPTAAKIWEKPGGVARSWVECGDQLNYSAMVEMPCGEGDLIATQLRVGSKLAVEPAARVLLADMLVHADRFTPVSPMIAVYAPDRRDITDMVNGLGQRVKQIDSLNAGLDVTSTPVLVVHASHAALDGLNERKQSVEKYVDAGGWIMLWGLEPDGLAAYNELLGTHHLLREFRLERVTLVPDPLMAGLGNRDVALTSSQEIMFGDKVPAWDTFTYCVDGEDIAPFCHLPGQTDAPYKPIVGTENHPDSNPYNLVNGLTSEDFWWFILQIWHGSWPTDLAKAGSPPFTFGLPEPCKLKNIEIWNNAYYDTIKDMEINADDSHVATVQLPDASAPTELSMSGRSVDHSISLIVRGIRKHGNSSLVGIDNVRFIRELPDWYKDRVFPLVNVSALVRYPRGKGGFVLNEIKLSPGDTKENAEKKRRIVSLLLQNMIAR
jgi:hypothetical protein